MEDLLTWPLVLFLSGALLGVGGYFGARADEMHIAQMAAQNVARTAAVTNNQQAIVQAAQATVTGSGAPATWNGQPAIAASDVQIQTEDNGQLITAQVTYHAPVVFPQLMNWLGISSGWTQPITATATYYNELGNGSPGTVSVSNATGNTTANGTGGLATPQNTSFKLTIAVTGPAPATTFLNGQSVQITATSNQDVSMAPGDALQIYDQSTGQWLGMPTFSGTSDTVTVSGINESDTFVAYIAPWGTTSGAVVQSTPLTVQWISPSQLVSMIQVSATAYPGTAPGVATPQGAPAGSWTAQTQNGTNNQVWNNESVEIVAKVPSSVYLNGGSLALYNATTGQQISGPGSPVSVGTQNSQAYAMVSQQVTGSSPVTQSYGAQFTWNGQTFTTPSSSNVQVIWEPNISFQLGLSNNGGTITLTATASFPFQGSNANGNYTWYAFLYNQSLMQWYQPQGLTTSQNQVSWSFSQSQYAGDYFVAVLNNSPSVPSSWAYPQSGAQPPLTSNQQAIYTVTLTAQGDSTDNNVTLTATSNLPLNGHTMSIVNLTTGQVIASTTQGTTLTTTVQATPQQTTQYQAQIN
ncbi:hypothetical protein [Alicyclobacillus acidocaldarius]|uniref:Uncharacterized protein n=1 Tax=Alicyclobacillus acidocaldarius subsp. acidocaldarius (strain ATCC 27009 / DSM 446 / BCRC 14685 / JCM 5260 / KCTC 1825 / NBRC 15652 / NCIMB 11725 / NRRL B-14509 / 104-IA) TaxID=521098 RepID=C8WSZ8_ALIAD|nr:hypothetical protein [Alicyclobacillus acidocaldarius]ACV57654.1 hypothetical protein Aaci_0606 [Alicyclobacillus acidocaldarius subsp. acidocaldarius DSM 446]